MTPRLDQPQRYLQRLGYERNPPPTLATLRELQPRHTAAFPFETLANLLRQPVPVDLPSIERKLLHDGRGGYCFELNRAWLALLQHLGYEARPLTARVAPESPRQPVTPRTHLLVHVVLDGVAYVSDVGFGGMVPTAPLRLDTEEEQATPHEPYRITERDGIHTLHARVAGEWRMLYAFDLHPQEEIDLVVANWYVSTHPDSAFAGQLRVARTGPGWRKTLGNGRYSVHRPGRPSEIRMLADAGDVADVLQREFDLRLPGHPGLEDAIAGWLQSHAPATA